MSPSWPPIGFPSYIGLPMQTTYQKDYQPPPPTAYVQKSLHLQRSFSPSSVVVPYPFAAQTTYQTDFSRPFTPVILNSRTETKEAEKNLDKNANNANKTVVIPALRTRTPTYIIEKSSKHTPLVINGKIDFETTYMRDYKAYRPECYINVRKDKKADNRPVEYYIDLLPAVPPYIPITYVKRKDEDGKMLFETTYEKSYPAYDPKYYVVCHNGKRLDEESANYFDDLLPAIGPYNPKQIISMTEKSHVRENQGTAQKEVVI